MVVDIYLIPGPGPGPVESLIVRYVTYLPGRLVHVSCMRASKQAKDKTGRYKACSVLLLGMSRDRRIALCIPLHIHMLVLHTYFASLGDKVTVIANGRARIFFLCRCGTYLFPCPPPLRRQYRVGLKKVVLWLS